MAYIARKYYEKKLNKIRHSLSRVNGMCENTSNLEYKNTLESQKKSMTDSIQFYENSINQLKNN